MRFLTLWQNCVYRFRPQLEWILMRKSTIWQLEKHGFIVYFSSWYYVILSKAVFVLFEFFFTCVSSTKKHLVLYASLCVHNGNVAQWKLRFMFWECGVLCQSKILFLWGHPSSDFSPPLFLSFFFLNSILLSTSTNHLILFFSFFIFSFYFYFTVTFIFKRTQP